MAASADTLGSSQQVVPMPASLGRFKPLKVLGRGGQGVVYLASDPNLDREVAIKTLTRGSRNPERLLNEARNVAKLDHSSIVPLYETEITNGLPHLVYQFAPGTSLKALLAQREEIPVHRGIKIICQLLEAIGYAHANGILHRDLSPVNILVDAQDRLRVLDFGVSTVMDTAVSTSDIVGTVNYLPPECLSKREVGPHSDLFSIGVIFHELLTGKPLFTANSQMATTYKILNETILAPSLIKRDIDPALDGIVMKALARDPAERYREAGVMKEELEAYLQPKRDGESSVAGHKSGAIDLILRKMARKPDFPAISRFINEIKQKTANSDGAHANELSNVILPDYALTSKLLKLVNSAVYGQFGGSITTVSRAVMILGFNQVRAAALSIAIFEHMKNGTQADEIKDAACSSFLSANLARQVGLPDRGVDAEEAFIGAMFHRLGRHLAIFYFPEDYEEIKTVSQSRGISESAAAKEVLGASFAELGVAIGKQWNFPDSLIKAMTPLRDGKLLAANSTADKTAQLSAFVNEAAEAIGSAASDQDLELRLGKLIDRYGACVHTELKNLRDAVSEAVTATRAYAAVITLDLESATFFKKVIKRLDNAAKEIPAVAGGAAAPSTTTTFDAAGVGETAASEPAEDLANTEGRKAFLMNAITDLTSAMLDNITLNNIFVMVLEAFYRGMGFAHVMLLIRDPKRNMMQARFGFGENIQEIIPKFGFKTADGQGIFNESTRKGKESIVLDVDVDQYRTKVPQWCQELTNLRSVLLLPLLSNKTCIGLIYADKIGETAAISVQELKLLNTLIKQAALTIQTHRNG